MNHVAHPAAIAEHFVAADNSSTSIAAPKTAATIYSEAEIGMQKGKKMVIHGFVVAVTGIVAYCIACLSADASDQLSHHFFNHPSWLVGPTLGVIGLGIVLWLAGSYRYLMAAMDSDPEGADVNF